MKRELRRYYGNIRRAVSGKAEKDTAICNSVLDSGFYKSARQVFCYSALPDEINTDIILANALDSGRKIALPRCDDAFGNMSFYYISSRRDLKKGAFGISEPDAGICEKVTDFDGGICIVPGISFDKSGGRLGYGKGYYDRLLIKYALFSVGLCYNCCLCETLPAEKYDVRVGCIATENGLIYL